MKVVLDTNVLLSGMMSPGGVPGRIVAAWLEAQFEVVFSVNQLTEIGRVLTYPKIQRSLKWDEPMPNIKIGSKVDASARAALKQLADESHQSISGLLTEAVRDYVRKRRIRPDVLRHLEDSIERNKELGRRLAR